MSFPKILLLPVIVPQYPGGDVDCYFQYCNCHSWQQHLADGVDVVDIEDILNMAAVRQMWCLLEDKITSLKPNK